jgi:outer membrane protein assembly factor BamA
VKNQEAIKWILVMVLVLFTVSTAQAQDETDTEPTAEKEESSRVKFAAIPVINYDPAYKWNFAALANAFFKVSVADTISPLSMAGGMVGYTTNKSWYWALYTRMYLDEDNWRTTLAYGDASINFQFFEESINSFINFNSVHDFFLASFQRRVYKRWYLGSRFLSKKTLTEYEIDEEVGDPEKHNLNNLGILVSHDKRDFIYNPYHGDYMNFKAILYRDAWGADYVFDQYEFDFTNFFFIDDHRVIAAKFAAFIASGDVPFEGKYVVGREDIRGYTNGKHRANQVYSLQGEYRWNFYKKWGAVGFAGIATAVDDVSEINWSGLLPGAGVGLRYMAIPSEKINVGIDIALGQDDWGLYFRIGEVFGDK